ncbi:hypothetical protein B0A55_08778 [Friedmanniomyces simplex]|uniref:SnoaL-like domain-containing protein n=1 Tax=Friedmanniomyces simplex TaxID=329884 RepID=A0A4U0WV85_9PEZI|nr:hypothetical protein B0A55_08778 [Friedmanniomyces simplex]
MAPNALDYFAIQNTISRYCFALDTKDFELLKQVFTSDVNTIYPFGGQRKGVQSVADAIQKRHGHPIVQRGQAKINIPADGKSAEAVTYFTGIHFGKGKWDDRKAWGKYTDTLSLNDTKDSLPGASGEWLISRREVTFMGRLGEEGVMDGE